MGKIANLFDQKNCKNLPLFRLPRIVPSSWQLEEGGGGLLYIGGGINTGSWHGLLMVNH